MTTKGDWGGLLSQGDRVSSDKRSQLAFRKSPNTHPDYLLLGLSGENVTFIERRARGKSSSDLKWVNE